MTLAETIFAVNSVIQRHLNVHGQRLATPDQIAPTVYEAKIELPCEEGPPGAPAFRLREFFRIIRRSYGHEGLRGLLGVVQKDNQEGGRYTILRFDAPNLERIAEILKETNFAEQVAQTGSEPPEKADVLPDYLAEGLSVVFVGTSVGEVSAARQHYYSHATNKFWDLVNQSRLVGDWVGAENDHCILDEKCGLTDLSKSKISSSDSALQDSDFDVAGFIEKIKACRPKVVAFNGKRPFKETFKKNPNDYGLADDIIGDSYVFVLPSSSGADASLTYEQKLQWYALLKATLKTL